VLGIAFVVGVAADRNRRRGPHQHPRTAGARAPGVEPRGLSGPRRALVGRLAPARAQRARPVAPDADGPGRARPAHAAPTASAPLANAIAAFTAAWTERAAPLYAVRAARVLHLAAAVFAAGVLTGMYVRGLAFEYRASWESTFLGPETVYALLAFALAPGAWLTGIGVPDVAHIASIRTGADPGSENAALWLHLYPRRSSSS
jgi:hypothetical protein